MTLYFYDLETSGFNPREARIMQFAGQRTDKNLKPIGKPHNFLIKITEDILPDPDAVLVTGITPQKTIEEGITEAEFLKIFSKEIAVEGTVFTGFNTIRFDDEFMRYLHYRNFYEPYEWQWKEDRSRWDMLDVVRMTRALRPEGITWPYDSSGAPSNRLELLASVNKLPHANAHDALSDVLATIEMAKLIQKKQPKLFNYLLSMRNKQNIKKLVAQNQPFVYTSGKYPSEYEKTTVVISIAEHPKKQGVLVYDLRHDPKPFLELSVQELVVSWRRKRDEEGLHLPVKILQFNRCPAVAPMNVLDEGSLDRLKLDLKKIESNQKLLTESANFQNHLLKALEILDKQMQTQLLTDERTVDAQLYDGFISDADKRLLPKIQSAKSEDLINVSSSLHDSRLKAMLPLYKARNFPLDLSSEERQTWEVYRNDRLFGGGQKSWAARYFNRIEELRQNPQTTQRQQSLLTDLELYGQSLLPSD